MLRLIVLCCGPRETSPFALDGTIMMRETRDTDQYRVMTGSWSTVCNNRRAKQQWNSGDPTTVWTDECNR